jgi:transposase-like protein
MMQWNGKPIYCPHCGKDKLLASGNENVSNSQAWNQDHYICGGCNNEVDIGYSPKNYYEVKIDSVQIRSGGKK